MEAPTRKAIAEAYRLSVEHRLIEPARAIAWAERLVVGGEVESALLDVVSAWGRGAGPVADALRLVSGEGDPDTVFRLVLVFADERVSADAGQIDAVAGILYGIAVAALTERDRLFSEFVCIDDPLQLAHAGIYGTVADARRVVVESIRAHRADTID